MTTLEDFLRHHYERLGTLHFIETYVSSGGGIEIMIHSQDQMGETLRMAVEGNSLTPVADD